jgi:prepilin-type N-terminal cleavage/methylation domain-containing protein
VSSRRRRSAGRRAFTLLEVVFAVVIIATALLGLQATVAGSIRSAGNSINRRAAREECRQKLEEVLAGTIEATDAGELPDRPNFKWAVRTEEVQVGAGETKSEVVRVVTVEMQFPADSETGPEDDAGGARPPATSGATGAAGAGGGPTDNGDGTQTLSLSSILPDPPGQAPGAAPAPPR